MANDKIFEVGCYSIVIYDDVSAAAVFRDTKVISFDEVSAEHAYKEGEGSGGLEEWREVHRKSLSMMKTVHCCALFFRRLAINCHSLLN